MSRGVAAASPQSVCSPPRTQFTIRRPPSSVNPPQHSSFSSNLKLVPFGMQSFPRINLIRCRSTGDSGENESKTILDAFFLGKALAETLNERIESVVGEFLSTIGRLQAQQQKQVQEFQEEVLEKARRAKEQAAREAMEARGLIPKSTAAEVPAVNGVASESASSQTSSSETTPTFDFPPNED